MKINKDDFDALKAKCSPENNIKYENCTTIYNIEKLEQPIKYKTYFQKKWYNLDESIIQTLREEEPFLYSKLNEDKYLSGLEAIASFDEQSNKLVISAIKVFNDVGYENNYFDHSLLNNYTKTI